jgi:hypothetical protein
MTEYLTFLALTDCIGGDGVALSLMVGSRDAVAVAVVEGAAVDGGLTRLGVDGRLVDESAASIWLSMGGASVN